MRDQPLAHAGDQGADPEPAREPGRRRAIGRRHYVRHERDGPAPSASAQDAAARRLQTKHQAGQMLARHISERLCFLWRVDAGQAHLVLHVLCIEHGDGVAVAETDHGAGELFSGSAEGCDDEE